MKEDKSIFLKVDCVEPVLKGGGDYCSRLQYLDGIRVWIGSYGYFFPCDRFTICNPDAATEDGRSQVRDLAIELTNMPYTYKNKLFDYSTVGDIFSHFSYDEIKEKVYAWKKEKEKIRVRDEVCHQSMQVKFVVTKIYVPSGDEDAIVNGIKKDGTTVKGLLLHNVKKTGLHVDDLDSYLEV